MVRNPKPIEEQIQEVAQSQPQQIEQPVVWDQVVSTGSTLLDLAISGGVTNYGGLPGGIIVWVYGKNSTGKTTLMAETLGYVQRAGGEYKVKDPEARLVPAYCATFGVKLNQDEIDRSPDVPAIFEFLVGPLESKKKGDEQEEGSAKRNVSKGWCPDPSRINFYGVDSIASLVGRFEKAQGDKMGGQRPKEFSQGFRLISDHIYKHNILMFCTDQTRKTMASWGEQDRPSGGEAMGFYNSITIVLTLARTIYKEVSFQGSKSQKHAIGIDVEAFIKKSSLDKPFRKAPLRIIFNYGVDDIGANLQWLKDNGGFAELDEGTGKWKSPSYVVDGRKFAGLEAAVRFVEENNLEQVIKEQTMALWRTIEAQLHPARKEKVRQ